MKFRKRIYYTDSDKELMWDRYCEGDSLHAIARLFDRSHGSIAGIQSVKYQLGIGFQDSCCIIRPGCCCQKRGDCAY